MNKKLLKRYYEGMFSEKEFEQLYEGKQFYMDNEEYLDRFKMRQEFLQQSFKETPEESHEHECKCENCSCNEEDPTIRQVAEEMFEEAIPQNVRDIEIQWEPRDDTLMPEDIAKPKCSCLSCRDEV